MTSGIHSTIISACWSSGARSEVPEMLPPTVPEKSVRPRATPYSVTEVQNGDLIGGRLCSLQSGGGVCHDEVNAGGNEAVGDGGAGSGVTLCVLEVELHVVAELCGQSVLKPCVAASRAACCTSWQMPMV